MEPKTATVLSAEIPGFAELSAKYSSKEFNTLLKAFFEMADVTFRLHKGILSNFSGDSFLAVFEKQDKGDFSELFALEGANEFHDRLESFISDKNLPVAIQFKAGISSGEAIIAEISSEDKRQITVMGEAVNNANRLRDFADDNQILVCGKIFSKTNNQYTFQKLEPLPVRGSKENLEVYELREKKRTKIQPGSIPERKIASVMVGREREIDLLEEYIKNLVTGKGTVINIVGKAGIGKSRLMAEIKAQSLFKGMVLLQGSASSIGKNLSYHPIISIFKSWAKIIEDDSPVVSAGKLQKEIQRVAPKKVDEIYPFIATMMGLPLTGKHKERIAGIEGEALEKLILKNIRDLIITSVKVTPLIIVIEDMHWADSSSITILESLFKLSVNHRVMFINVLRPGYKETGDYVLKHLVDNLPGNHITINIVPLAATESNELIGNLLQQTRLPDKINEVIVKKTEGNPFFIEEVIRSFIDEGIVEIKDNKFRVTDKIHTAKIPETINEVILSRVDKLDEKTKELLRTASVIGRNFYYKLLEEAADTIGELDSRIEYLKEVQLISETKPKQEIEFLFKHALAQQLTYDSIIQQSRKDLHLKIAGSIEKVFAGNIQDYYGSLAYHYIKAENQEKAITYLIKAGDESLKSGASSEALNFYKDAFDRLPESRKQNKTDTEIRDMEIKIAFAYQAIGKNVEAIACFEVIIYKYFGYKFAKSDLALKIRGISSMLIFMFMINNQSLFFKRKVDDNFHLYMRVIKEWGQAIATVNPRHFALLSFHLLVYMSKFQLNKSIRGLSVFVECNTLFMWTGISFDVSKKMLEYARNGGADQNPISKSTYRFSLKMHEFMTGKWELDQDYQKLFDTTMRIGDYWPLTIYTLYSGMVNIEIGDFEAFSDSKNKLNEVSESFDNSHAKAQMYRMTAPAYCRFRQVDQAIKLADEGIDYTIKTGHTAMLLVVYCAKSQAHTFKSQLNEARKVFAKADKLIDRHKIITIYHTPYLLAKVKLEFAELKTLSENDRNYKPKLKELNKTADKLISKSKKMIGSLTEAYLIRADIYQFLNKNKEVFKYYGLAIATGEKYNGRLELSRAYFETGKFLSNPNTKQNQLNGLSAKDYLDKARAMFEEMDLQWDLKEYGKFIKKDWKTKS